MEVSGTVAAREAYQTRVAEGSPGRGAAVEDLVGQLSIVKVKSLSPGDRLTVGRHHRSVRTIITGHSPVPIPAMNGDSAGSPSGGGTVVDLHREERSIDAVARGHRGDHLRANAVCVWIAQNQFPILFHTHYVVRAAGARDTHQRCGD